MTRMELLSRIAVEEGPAAAATAVRLLDADAWIAATARLREAVLVHCDPELARADQVRQERLGR
jgi:predicted nucleic acid-binding protein